LAKVRYWRRDTEMFREKGKLVAVIILIALVSLHISGLFVQSALGAGRTWIIPQDYQTIDAGIIAASPGDIVQVASGNYTGFVVDKAVEVTASPGVFVKGDVRITADGAKLTNLRIIGGISVSASGCTLSGVNTDSGVSLAGNNNRIASSQVNNGDANTGIEIYGSANTISGNTIKGFFGVYVNTGAGTKIENNVINQVVFFKEGTSGASVSNNKFSGIDVRATGSQISNNNANGYILVSGLGSSITGNIVESISIGTSNIVSGNTIQSNSTALSIGGSNNIIQNNILNSLGIGIKNSAGWIGGGGSNNTISNNLIESVGNAMDFSTVAYFSTGSPINNIYNNTIKTNATGIIAKDCPEIVNNRIIASNIGIDLGQYPLNNTKIAGNLVSLCATGLRVSGSGYLIYSNNFVDNTVQAVDNSGNSWSYNGKGNYWSDWTSPDANNDGIVDNPYVISGTGRSVDRYPLVNTVTWAPEQSPSPTISPTPTLEPTESPSAALTPSPSTTPSYTPITSSAPSPSVPEFPLTAISAFLIGLISLGATLQRKRKTK
jgi:nitrous oxidase accessory protein NosD